MGLPLVCFHPGAGAYVLPQLLLLEAKGTPGPQPGPTPGPARPPLSGGHSVGALVTLRD